MVPPHMHFASPHARLPPRHVLVGDNMADEQRKAILDAAVTCDRVALSEALATCGDVQQQARALLEASTLGGNTALTLVCAYRDGGGGVDGWPGCIRLLLRIVSTGAGAHACEQWVRKSSCYGSTALYVLARDKNVDDAAQLPAIVALLAHGADATMKNRWGETPRDFHIWRGNNDADVVELLRLAEELGDGSAAVARFLQSDRRATVTENASWMMFASLPALALPRLSRVLLATWAAARKRRRERMEAAAIVAPCAAWQRAALECLPRVAVAALLQQLSLS